MSTKTIEARSKSNYNHRMGRGGYTGLREKLVSSIFYSIMYVYMCLLVKIVKVELPIRALYFQVLKYNALLKSGFYMPQLLE